MNKAFLLIFVLYTTTILAQPDLKNHIAQRDSVAKSMMAKMYSDMAKHDSVFYSNVGKQYLDFSATGLDNETITEKCLVAKITLINFWIENCAPCVAEFDGLNKLYLKYKNNPEFQLISFTKDEAERAEKAKLKYSINYPIYPILGMEAYRLNLNNGYPTTIITDKKGTIFYLTHGGYTKKELVEKQVQLFEEKIIEALSAK